MAPADHSHKPDLQAALQAFAGALSPENVVTERAALQAAERATFFTTQRIPAILYPQTRSQVQDCLRIANRFRVPLYPTSTGKNWGYGSRVPIEDGNVLLCLQRMDRIVEFDERLAYVTLQPGVTFVALHTFLRQQKSRRILWGTGSAPDTSIIGNTVERGLSRGPGGDRWLRSCALEVVLPTGECIHTGLARFSGARAAALHRAGVGPSLDGLFTQSNLGVVTQMTLWLDTAPAVSQRVAFSLSEPAQLHAVIEALRELLLPETVRLSMSLLNTERVRELNRSSAGSGWRGEGVLASSSEESGQAERRLLESVLKPCVDQLLFEKRPNDPELLGPPALDPDRDGCGLLFFSPVLPFDGDAVREAVQLVQQCCVGFGVAPGISLRCVTPRALYLIGSITYDRAIAGEDTRAADCHRALWRRLSEAGFLPYRMGQSELTSPPCFHGDSGVVLETLKHALDPQDILARGRYDFRSDWPNRED